MSHSSDTVSDSLSEIRDVLSDGLPGDKWSSLYSYSKNVLEEDYIFIKNLDEKSGKFLSLVSILIGIITTATPWLHNNVFTKENPLKYLAIVTFFLGIFTLLSAWSQLFRGIKLAAICRLPLTTDIFTLFFENEIKTISYELACTCKEALEENRKVFDLKTKHLQIAYRDIALTAWLSVVTSALSLYIYI